RAGAGSGWGSAVVVGLLLGSGAALALFWWYVLAFSIETYLCSVEMKVKEPVMPMRLFTHRTNVAAYFVGMCHRFVLFKEVINGRMVYMGLTYYLTRIIVCLELF